MQFGNLLKEPIGVRGASFALAAVAGVEPRTAIRAALSARGWVDGRDFCAVA